MFYKSFQPNHFSLYLINNLDLKSISKSLKLTLVLQQTIEASASPNNHHIVGVGFPIEP